MSLPRFSFYGIWTTQIPKNWTFSRRHSDEMITPQDEAGRLDGRGGSMGKLPVTERTSMRRLPERASYDEAVVHAILDEALICHVAFVFEGRPIVLPTGYARIGDRLYLHGSAGGRFFRALAEGTEVTVAVTLLDGMVLARSAFHHSMNYRSVVIFGRTEAVEGESKRKAIEGFVDRMIPGRSASIRPASEAELRKTLVIAIPIAEASAKVRSGPPVDDEDDYGLPVWAGELPLILGASDPVPDPRMKETTDAPDHVARFRGRFVRVER